MLFVITEAKQMYGSYIVMDYMYVCVFFRIQ